MKHSQGHNLYERSGPNWGGVSNSDDQQLVDLSKVIRILWQRRFVIAICAITTTLLASAYILITPSTYTARAVLLIDSREIQFTDADAVLSGIGADSAAIASQVSVLSSRELLMQVLEKENLFQDSEFSSASSKSKSSVYENFVQKLSVERQGLTYVIDVAFTSRDPEKAARITNAIVSQYIQTQINEKSNANTYVNEVLKSQIDVLSQNVLEAESDVDSYLANKGIVEIGPGQTLLQTQLQQLSEQVSEARARVRVTSSRFKQAKSISSNDNALITDPDILSSTAVDQLLNEYNEKTIELTRLSETYAARHPIYITQLAEVQRIKSLMNVETKRIVKRLEAEFKLANEELANAEGELARLRTKSEAMREDEIGLRQLEFRATASREVLQQFMRRSQETGQLENLSRAEARIISSAVPPIHAAWPRSSLLLAIAAFLGTVIGFVVAILLGEKTKKGRRQNVPLLGRIFSDQNVWLSQSGRYDRHALDAVKNEFCMTPKSSFSYQVQEFKQNLVDQLAGSSTPQILTIASTISDVESCRISYNIAAAFNADGSSVLVLDLCPLAPNLIHEMKNELVNELNHPDYLDPSRLLDRSTGLPLINVSTSNRHLERSFVIDVAAMDRIIEKSSGVFEYIIVNAGQWSGTSKIAAILGKSSQLVLVANQLDVDTDKLVSLSTDPKLENLLSFVVMEASNTNPVERNPNKRRDQQASNSNGSLLDLLYYGEPGR